MIEIKGLEIRVPGFRVVIDSLLIREKEYMVLLGPSGVGKTLLLLAIAGIVKPSKGRILINNRDVTHEPPERRGVALVPQNYALFPHMSVYDNIAYGLRAKGLPEETIREEVNRVAELLGISKLLSRKPSSLSGGEQQRVALARALVVKPRLLLLDEPLSALDPELRIRARRLLKRLHREIGFTALHVTHSLSEALCLATRIAYMEKNTIIGVYEPREFIATEKARPYLEEEEVVIKALEEARSQ